MYVEWNGNDYSIDINKAPISTANKSRSMHFRCEYIQFISSEDSQVLDIIINAIYWVWNSHDSCMWCHGWLIKTIKRKKHYHGFWVKRLHKRFWFTHSFHIYISDRFISTDDGDICCIFCNSMIKRDYKYTKGYIYFFFFVLLIIIVLIYYCIKLQHGNNIMDFE